MNLLCSKTSSSLTITLIRGHAHQVCGCGQNFGRHTLCAQYCLAPFSISEWIRPCINSTKPYLSSKKYLKKMNLLCSKTSGSLTIALIRGHPHQVSGCGQNFCLHTLCTQYCLAPFSIAAWIRPCINSTKHAHQLCLQFMW